MGNNSAPDVDVILAKALSAGFDIAGVADPATIQEAGAKLHDFVAKGRHGTMAWMQDRISWRADPCTLWPEVKSVIMLGLNYGPDGDPLALLERPDRGNISVYARNKDYHDSIKKRLKVIARSLVSDYGCDLKVFVDTAPVMEKPLAAAAGLGWQGKHTNLISPDLGNWFFLGAIFTDMELPAAASHKDQCGSCRACLDACPTDAFPAPYQIDARRCISYLTIEHKGPVDEALRPLMGNRIYGCDDCLAACPWNKFAKISNEAQFHARVELTMPRLTDLVQLDDAGFRALFTASPIKRIGRDRFVRNVLYALGNSGDRSAVPHIHALLSDDNDVVRDAAKWAVSKLNEDS